MNTCGALTIRSGQRPKSSAMPSSRMRKYVSWPEGERLSMRKRAVPRVKKSLSSMSSGLRTQDPFLESLLHLRHKLLVPVGIDERVRLRAGVLHLLLQVEETGVRAEED